MATHTVSSCSIQHSHKLFHHFLPICLSDAMRCDARCRKSAKENSVASLSLNESDVRRTHRDIIAIHLYLYRVACGDNFLTACGRLLDASLLDNSCGWQTIANASSLLGTVRGVRMAGSRQQQLPLCD